MTGVFTIVDTAGESCYIIENGGGQMRKFWGFYDNGTYKVGCNGATMYLYDAEGRELAKFRDIPYAYEGAFKPGTNIFLLRSTEGSIAVYDCDGQKLLRKFRYSEVDGAQDDGFCFSPDGKYFLNIERIRPGLCTRLSVYETGNYSPVKRLFEADTAQSLNDIECVPGENRYSILFFLRDDSGVYDQGYVGQLRDDRIVNPQPLAPKAYRFLRDYKDLQRRNFTEKSMEWSGLHYAGYTNDEILNLRDRHFQIHSFPEIAGEVIK